LAIGFGDAPPFDGMNLSTHAAIAIYEDCIVLPGVAVDIATLITMT